MHSEAKLICWSQEKRKVYSWPRKQTGGQCPTLLEGFQQSSFQGKVREGHGQFLQTSWCQDPLSLQLSTEVRSECSCKPSIKQMLFSILQCFVSIRKDFLRIKALRIGYPIYFMLQATLFYKSGKAIMTKHKQQNRSNLESDLFFPVTLGTPKFPR